MRRHEVSRRALHRLKTPLRWIARTDLFITRPPRPRHRLRTPMPASQADQHLDRAGRPEARHQGSRRGHLARQLHALASFRTIRRTNRPAAAVAAAEVAAVAAAGIAAAAADA